MALILALSGGSVLARGLRLLTDPGTPEHEAFRAFILDVEWPISILVLTLALLHPHRYVRGRIAKTALAAWLLVWGAAWAVVIFQKAPIYVPIGDGRYGATWASFLVDDMRYYLTMAAALALFGWAYARRPRGSSDHSAGFLLLAFAVGPLVSVYYLVFRRILATPEVVPLYPPLTAAQYLMSILGTALMAGAFLWAILEARRRGHPTRMLALGGGLALALGVVNEFLRTSDPLLSLVFGQYGEFAYLIVRPVILGYAILRFQLFDADVRVKRGFATLLLILTIGALFLPVEEAVRRLSGLPPDLALPAGIAAGLGVTLALYARVQGFAQGAADSVFRAVREEDTRYLEERKRELYRAALERALDDRLVLTPHGEDDVKRLRKRLGIRETEHEALLAEVREAAWRSDRQEGNGTPAPVGALLLGRYRVLDLLGEGGSGRTYRCLDTRLDREVAVKEIHTPHAPGDRTRRAALKEARLLASIRHPRVVGLHDVHELGARTFLVMELLPGGSLAQRIERDGPLPPEEAARLTGDVLEGLEALHEAGLVHRDVKPSNVLLDAKGRARLADLGVAQDPLNVTLTGLARPKGTPAYMSPEQVLGNPVDARADLYAVAALLYEALTGEAYVRPAMRAGVLVEEAIVSTPPPLPVESAPSWANEFLRRGLAKDPALRWPSAGAARAFLREAAPAESA